MRILNSFLRQPRPILFSAFLAIAILIAFCDYVTGYEVSLGIFYTLPVILALWYCGKWGGGSMALITIFVRHFVDIASKHPYSHQWIHVWNDCIRLAYLGMILYGAAAAKQQIEAGNTQIKSLLGILPICTSCKRIRGKDGYWTEVDSYLRINSLAEPSAKLCPECSMRHFAVK